MIGYAMVGSNNLSLSELFYDAVFKSLGLIKVGKKSSLDMQIKKLLKK